MNWAESCAACWYLGSLVCSYRRADRLRFTFRYVNTDSVSLTHPSHVLQGNEHQRESRKREIETRAPNSLTIDICVIDVRRLITEYMSVHSQRRKEVALTENTAPAVVATHLIQHR